MGFGSQEVSAFLDDVAARTPAPGGGAVVAVTVAAAAALTAMAARFSADLPGADLIAAEADELRTRATGLADADAKAYGAVLAAYRTRAGRDRLRDALRGAADVPLAVAAAGARVAELAAQVVAGGNRNLLGDAHAALLLAQAAAGAAANLVEINVEQGGLDEALTVAARAHVATAAAALTGVS